MKKASMLNSRSCDHSDKMCVCGGHSRKDVKKNKNHNSTKRKLSVRKTKQTLNKQQ